MAIEEEDSQVKTEFPVDVKPLIRSVVIYLIVFIGICALVYLQSSEEIWALGNLFLAFAFCFAAYTQKEDKFRVAVILGGGLLLCLILYLTGGGADVEDEPVRRPARNRVSQDAPEGL